MAKHTLKILRGSYRKIFQVCLAIFQHYEIKGLEIFQFFTEQRLKMSIRNNASTKQSLPPF